MCGIAGFFNYKTRLPASSENLEHVLESMRYRGPDNLGIYCDSDIAIGNVRLAIQGISEEGNQPIFNEDKSIVAVFNGEIYNYPELKSYLKKKGHNFSSATDTEILVHLYEEFGDNIADKLNGMFSFALFDTNKRYLILGRDRTAQKPLYIHRNAQGIFFSSELKAMLPHLEGPTLNPSSVRTFLSIGYTLESETILNEVETLEPASIIKFTYSGEKTRRFWSPEVDQPKVISDIVEWKERADASLKCAVNRHLLSDVPVALFLSGGIDSSLLSLYLKDEGRIKKAFTGSFVDRSDHDEYDFASTLGRHCGFQVERVRLSNKLLADNIEDFLSGASMPQGDYSGLATFCISREVSKSFKVILGGDGGDEFFGGYPTYTLPYLSKRFRFVPKGALKLAHRLSSHLYDRGKYLSLPFKLQQLYLAWGQEAIMAHFMAKNFLNDNLAMELLKKPFIQTEKDNGAEEFFRNIYDNAPFTDTVHKLCWVDFNTFLRSQTIPKVERNTMQFSLEARLPFLDNEILDLSLHTDSSLMINKTGTKLCLKSLLKDKMGKQLRLNPIKQGFSPPLVDMLENELKEWKDHWINYPSPLFKSNLARTLSNWKNRGWDLHRLEWNICTLNDWCFRNKIIN